VNNYEDSPEPDTASKLLLKKYFTVMRLKTFTHSFILLLSAALLFSSCSSVRYTYYKKHKVPGAAPEEVKFAKAIPAKPFLAQAEHALKQNAEVAMTVPPSKAEAKNTLKEIRSMIQEPQKIASDFDINNFFTEHKIEIKKKDGGGMLDDRTTIIILLVILILLLLALIGDGLLWLLWLALLVLLIFALIKYLDLLG
jgi:hypothetical protein